jgi:hypothetical protein
MASGYLYVRREPASCRQLIALLTDLTSSWSIEAYRYQERMDAVELDWAQVDWGETLNQAPDTRVPITLWPVGRAFCDQFEIRWQVVDAPTNHYQVQVATEFSLDLPASEWIRQTFDQVSDEYLTYLLGKREQADLLWTETRFLRCEEYPVKWEQDKPMVAIYARDYRLGGITRLTRLMRVEATKEPGG